MKQGVGQAAPQPDSPVAKRAYRRRRAEDVKNLTVAKSAWKGAREHIVLAFFA
jgi:hypothetical protein